MKTIAAVVALSLAMIASPAMAHKIIAPELQEKIAGKQFSATPNTEWNRLQQKGGKYQEIWTIDGDDLNKVTFYGAVPSGEALFKERNKKEQPLPKVASNMLLTDIPTLLEATYRTQFQTTKMTIDKQEAFELDGEAAIRFSYSFIRNDDLVERTGEGIGSLRDGKLYLITYEAPSLFFFQRSHDEFLAIASSLKINR